MNQQLKNALPYAKAGWKLFPAVWHNGKHFGCVKWAEGSSADPAVLTQWAEKWPDAYFCVNLRASGLMVLDIDTKNGKGGDQTLAQLESQHGKLPETLCSRTPSGGDHYFMSGQCSQSSDKLGPGVDTVYMVPLPGSVVPGKGTYTLTRRAKPAPMPTWVSELAGRQSEKKEKHEIPACELDLDHNVSAAAQMLSNAEPVTKGEGANDATYRLACRVRDMGVTKDTATQLMLDHWYDRCEPNNKPEFVERLVGNAYRYSNDRAGNATPEAGFKGVAIPSGLTVQPADPETVTSMYDQQPITGDTLGVDLPPPQKMVYGGPGGLPRGKIGVVSGQGGCGKTKIMVQLAASVASGTDCCDGVFQLKAQGPVLAVLAEDDQREVSRSMYHLRQKYPGVDLSNFHVFPHSKGDPRLFSRDTGGNPYPTQGFQKLKDHVIKIQPVMVIIDSFSVAAGVCEQSNDDAAFAMSVLSQLCDAGDDATVVCIAHSTKASLSSKAQGGKNARPEDVLDQALDPNSVRGASALVNNARWCMTMTLVPKQVRKKLGSPNDDMITAYAVRKTNYTRPMFLDYLRHESKEWGPDNETMVLENFNPVMVDEISDEEHKEVLLMLVERYPDATKREFCDNTEVSDVAMISRQKVRELIDELVDEGRVKEVKSGRRKLLHRA